MKMFELNRRIEVVVFSAQFKICAQGALSEKIREPLKKHSDNILQFADNLRID